MLAKPINPTRAQFDRAAAAIEKLGNPPFDSIRESDEVNITGSFISRSYCSERSWAAVPDQISCNLTYIYNYSNGSHEEKVQYVDILRRLNPRFRGIRINNGTHFLHISSCDEIVRLCVPPTLMNVRVNHIRPQYHDLAAWTRDPNNVYIGRGRIVIIGGQRFPPADSPWHNPFKVGKDGTRDEVIAKYRVHILEKN
jgi:hypothetical protein